MMEQHFGREALVCLWMMFLLTGFLQLHPVPKCHSIDPNNLGLELLEEISCNGTMNFTSPVVRNEDEECYVAALRLFIKGMQDAEEDCTDEDGNIKMTRETLEQRDCLNMITTDCDFTTKVHQQFGHFVKEKRKFVQQWNDVFSQ